MKVIRGELLKALDLVKHAVDTSVSAAKALTMLADCEVGTEDGKLCITADDHGTRIRTSIEADGELATTILPYNLLSKVLKAPKTGKGQTVELTATDAGLAIQIAARKFSVAKSKTKEERAPAPKKQGESYVMAWDGADFNEALAFTRKAMCKDETRFHLNVVLLEGDRMITTDGNRMHIVDGITSFATPVNRGEAEPVQFGCADALLAALKVTKPDSVFSRVYKRRADDLVEFSVAGGGVTVLIQNRVGHTTFPPWRQVVPQEFGNTFTVNSDLLKESLDTATKMIRALDTLSKGARLIVNGDLTVGDQEGSFTEKIALSGKADKDQTFCVNPAFLSEAMLGGDACIKLNDDLAPVMVEYGNRRAVVMPMRGD